MEYISLSLHVAEMATKRSKSSCSEKGDSLGHNIQNLPSPPVTPKKRRYSTYSELLASFSPRKQPVSELDGCIPGNSNSCADIITVEKEVIEKSFSTYCISKSNKSEHASLMTNKDCSSQDKGSIYFNGALSETYASVAVDWI